MLEFFDLTEPGLRSKGRSVASTAELMSLVEGFSARPPFVGELTDDRGITLTVGLGGRFAFVQFCATDGDVPYSVAVAPELRAPASGVEFNCGGTPTPIEARFCLSPDIFKAILSYFFETAGKNPVVTWEEI